MHQYMLLLYNGPMEWDRLSPEDMQKATEKYIAWAQRPIVKGSQRLADDPGRVLKSQGGQIHTTDGPYSETKEMISGYYVIEASSYDEAVRLSKDHPHLEFGGTVEVRQLFEP